MTTNFIHPGLREDGFDATQDLPQTDAIHQQLGRIMRSDRFRVSLQLTRFLKFVVEATLAGKGDRIKAYTIAVEALGRGSDFDPQNDPIVRVEAGRLRHALARYYAGPGELDPLVIDLPRGSYVPTFRPRARAGSGSAPLEAKSTAAITPPVEVVLRDSNAELLNAALRHLVDLCELIPALIGPARDIAGSVYRDTRPRLSDDWQGFDRWLGIDAARLLGLNTEKLSRRRAYPARATEGHSDEADEDGRPAAAGDDGARTATAFRLIGTLDELSGRLLASPDLKSAVEAILEAAIRLQQADFGHVQLLDGRTNELIIYAQRGFGEMFLKTFERVSADDGCSCGRALRNRAPVIIEDVLRDSEFAAFRAVASEAGYRAVQSTPLITSNGKLVGVVSTHFARPHRPSPLDMLMTCFYGHLAADIVERMAPAEHETSAKSTHRAA